MAPGAIRSLGSIDPRTAYAGHLAARMVRGDRVEVHDVMVAAEEAQLAFELLLEVRNKLLEGYQEIMRMQV